MTACSHRATPRRARTRGAALGLVAVLGAAGCTTGTAATGSAAAIAVRAGDSSCTLAQPTLAAGRHTVEVTNTGSQVTEVYVYAPGDRIVGEVENIGPATHRTLIVDLPAGRYQVACKPGMVGTGIRTALRVTGSSSSSAAAPADLAAAVTAYRAYVRTEAAALRSTGTAFTAAVLAGNLARARQAYPAARLHYERIEPVAGSFGDLDPLIDMRVDDVTAGSPFVGFHALERLLFQRHTLTGTAPLARALAGNLVWLDRAVPTLSITALTMANGAKSLLDEVARSKVTGEEERYSHLDLVDFAGNVEGAKYVYTVLRPAVLKRDPALAGVLDHRFAALLALLGTHAASPGRRGYLPGSPYVAYTALGVPDVKALAVEVDAISEPLGRLGAAVTAR